MKNFTQNQEENDADVSPASAKYLMSDGVTVSKVQAVVIKRNNNNNIEEKQIGNK